MENELPGYAFNKAYHYQPYVFKMMWRNELHQRMNLDRDNPVRYNIYCAATKDRGGMGTTYDTVADVLKAMYDALPWAFDQLIHHPELEQYVMDHYMAWLYMLTEDRRLLRCGYFQPGSSLLRLTDLCHRLNWEVPDVGSNSPD